MIQFYRIILNMHTRTPVSYTHLDVYKRQDMCSEFLSFLFYLAETTQQFSKSRRLKNIKQQVTIIKVSINSINVSMKTKQQLRILVEKN